MNLNIIVFWFRTFDTLKPIQRIQNSNCLWPLSPKQLCERCYPCRKSPAIASPYSVHEWPRQMRAPWNWPGCKYSWPRQPCRGCFFFLEKMFEEWNTLGISWCVNFGGRMCWEFAVGMIPDRFRFSNFTPAKRLTVSSKAYLKDKSFKQNLSYLKWNLGGVLDGLRGLKIRCKILTLSLCCSYKFDNISSYASYA